MSILPLLTAIYKERMTLQEEVQALYTIEETMNRHILGMKASEQSLSQPSIFVKEEAISEHVTRFCSSWTGTNGRTYEHCFPAAK